jgi:hypothetical protein
VEKVDARYTIRYGGAAGDAYNLTASRTDRYTREIMRTRTETIALDQTEYRFEIESSYAGSFVVGVEFLRRIHETGDPETQAGPDFSRLTGKKAGFALARTGELSAFEGFDALPEFDIVDQGQAIGGRRFVNEIREIFMSFPADPVGVGETWFFTKEYVESIPGGEAQVTLDCTYEILGEEKRSGLDCLKLGGDLIFHAEGGGSASGIDYVLRLDGQGSDVVYFDLEKGMILSVERTSTVQGSAENEKLGMVIPMKHEYETRIDVVFE